MCVHMCIRASHACPTEFFCDTGSGDAIVYNPRAISHTHCLLLCVSHTLTHLPRSHRDIPSPRFIWAGRLWSRSLAETNTHSYTYLWSVVLQPESFVTSLNAKVTRNIHTADLWPWKDCLCLCKVIEELWKQKYQMYRTQHLMYVPAVKKHQG